MHSAWLVIFYLVCPRSRTYGLWNLQKKSPLSFRIRLGVDHERRACNLRTNEMLFWAREDFAQMSLEALVIVATAVEAHGPSFENHTCQNGTRQMCNVHNLKQRTFQFQCRKWWLLLPIISVLLTCMCSSANCIFTSTQYLSYQYIRFSWAYTSKYFWCWPS